MRLAAYNRTGNGRKPDSKTWEDWTNQLQEFFKDQVTPAKVQQMKVRLKAKFDHELTLRTNTGLGWDPVTGAVTCTDEYWEDFAKVKCLNNDSLCIQFMQRFCLCHFVCLFICRTRNGQNQQKISLLKTGSCTMRPLVVRGQLGHLRRDWIIQQTLRRVQYTSPTKKGRHLMRVVAKMVSSHPCGPV